jgi:hypothetical protein
MCLEAWDAEIDDVVQLLITGKKGRYIGKVVEKDDKGYPIIQVEKARLKWGDYVLLDRS